MAPAPELKAPRAPLGSARDVRTRLAAQRRPAPPLAVAAYAALLGDAGLVGPPRQRRALRFVARSAPAAVAVAGGALVALGAFAGAARVPLAVAGGALAASAAALVVRRIAAVRAGRQPALREELELGSVLLVGAAAAAQGSPAVLGFDAPLHPFVYLAVATFAALLPRAAGVALAGAALALEALLWWGEGAQAAGLPALGVRAGFVVLFAVLYHGVLGARIAAGRRAEAAAVERRRRELDERARQLRLLAGASEVGEGDRAERAERLAEAAVLEADGAVRGLLEVAETALRAHTVAAWLLSEDDRELRLWEGRSRSDRLARSLPAGEGPLGGVVKRRAPLRLHGEVRAANHYEDGARPRALVAVPLASRVGGHLRGVVLADRLDAEPFTDGDERLVTTLAGELARAALSEHLLEEGRKSRDETERFYQAIERLNREAKPREVFDAVLDAAAGMVRVDFGAVTLVDEQGATLRHRVARAVGPVRSSSGEGAPAGPRLERATSELEGLEFPDNGGLVGCAVRLASPLPGKELKLADAVVFDEDTRLKGLGSLKVLPLKVGDAVLGTLVLGARAPAAYRGDAARQLEVVAMQAAQSIQRARLFEATERLATTDGLTGLVNHRTFQLRLDEHLAAAQRYGKKVSLLLTDIDHFKSVNDTYGHPVGDVVLKGVAKILQKEARTTDVAARYGGEEFAVVMPETDREGAVKTAERIRERLAQAVFGSDQGELKVTLSIGVATFPQDARAKAELIELADGGLYHAKRHGRNQTVALGALRSGRRTA
jgi:two-component system, cell cycle response regulator